MTLRFAKTYRIAIAAALTLGVTGAAAAQADRRIPVNPKGGTAGGEVITRIDTVTVYRTDSVRVFRTDTVRIAGPTVTNTVTRYDTVTVETMPGWMTRAGGLYFGLGGGPSTPGGALYPAQSNGYNAQAQLGIDPIGSPLGLRLDINYNRLNEENNYADNRGRPDILNANADLKFRLPRFSTRFPLQLYAIGGGTFTRYKDIMIQLNETTAGTVGDNVAPSDGRWHDKWGWNAGGGFAFGWGKTELFTEYRIISFKPANAEAGHQFPLTIGINWY